MIPCESTFESNTGVYKDESDAVSTPELRPYLPPPHTGKANLTRVLGTGNQREANRLAVAWIADFQAAITSAASITENPNGYDSIVRYRAYHRGQNRFPSEAGLFPPHPALALPETQTKPVCTIDCSDEYGRGARYSSRKGAWGAQRVAIEGSATGRDRKETRLRAAVFSCMVATTGAPSRAAVLGCSTIPFSTACASSTRALHSL
jgi:hypothetical protein